MPLGDPNPARYALDCLNCGDFYVVTRLQIVIAEELDEPQPPQPPKRTSWAMRAVNFLWHSLPWRK